MAPPDGEMEDLNCPVCHELLRPYTMCESGHTACMSCITEMKKRQQACPLCQKPLNASVHITQNRLAINLAQRMGIVTCPNMGCPVMVRSGDASAEAHAARCEYAPVMCELGCGVRVLRCHMADHTQKECGYRTVACPRCKVEGLSKDVVAHGAVCPMAMVTCKWKCGLVGLLRRDQTEHEKNGCSLRAVRCKFCPAIVPRKSLSTHEDACAHRRVHCAACAVEIAAGEVDEHDLFACEKRTRACVGCDEAVPLHRYEAHVRGHGFDYVHGFGIDAFDVVGFRPMAVDLGEDGVVALVPSKPRDDAWTTRLELRTTGEFLAKLPTVTVSVEFPDSHMVVGTSGEGTTSLDVPDALVVAAKVPPVVHVAWEELTV